MAAALIHDWVSAQADRRPDALAVALDDDRLSYGALEIFSNQLARMLRMQGCRRGDRVCLLMPKSPLAIACLLGIYKADCIYVPLDPASPVSRLSKIVDTCENRLILAAGPVLPSLYELVQRHRNSLVAGWLDSGIGNIRDDVPVAFNYADVRACSMTPPGSENRPSDPAHILFTSGSTGTPKGVVITHANVAAFINWALRYFGLSESDRLSGHPPLHFDLSVFDIFGAFAAGAELHLVPAACNLLPNRLAEWMRRSRITQWFSVPSALNYMAKFNVVRDRDFPELKRVLWCGEVFPTPSLRYWMKRVPHAAFTNLYGPTEATIASSYYTVEQCPTDDKAAIPIGRACNGERLRVLNQELQPVSAGETGDLYIGGAGLSPGYWRNPDETARVFLHAPDAATGDSRIYLTGDLARIGDDGLVYFAGRKDYQVKSRGYRIELGEIETALNAVESLRECAVVAIPSDGFDGVRICCAYVAHQGSTVTHAGLRTRLSAELPAYMIPSQWRSLSELPRNPAGKVDRRKLAESWQWDATDTAR